ncbi:MAG: L-lactate dehydrogenase [Alphaproteobacteria bacterium]|nr:L-lactate dehydrogenase [Alphaproteobacteria bacterium]
MKISVIGAGMVGSCVSFLLAKELIGADIVLVDIDVKKAKAEALDIGQGIIYSGNSCILGAGIEGIKESDIVVITAGAKQNVGEKRESLRDRNEKIMQKITNDIKKYSPLAKIIVATNPVDEMVEVVRKSLLGVNSFVIGTGTELDSYRFRYYLGKYFKVCPKSIRADVLGLHNEKAKFVWSRVLIGEMTLSEFLQRENILFNDEIKSEIENRVIKSAFEIIEGKGATYWAIAEVTSEIVKSIVANRRCVFNVSVGEFGSMAMPL